MSEMGESVGLGSNRKIQDPFLMPSSASMADHMGNFLDFAKFCYYLNPKYRQASRRLVRYFITNLQFPEETDADQMKKRRDFLETQLKIMPFLGEFGDDGQAYGQSYIWIYYPFDRWVKIGKKYAALSSFPEHKVSFNLSSMKYTIRNKDGTSHVCSFIDIPSKDPTRICLRKLDPRYIYIRNHVLSGRRDVIWRIQEKEKRLAKEGHLFTVNDFPREILEAIKNEMDFMFSPQQVYVYTNPTLSGVSDYGIGLPEVLANYRSIFQVQVYRKMDEAIGLDYMLPFRIFTPNLGPSASATDITQFISGTDWTNQIDKIIKARRRDQFAMHSSPFPINMQEFGASGKTLAAKETMEFCTQDMLDSLGYPVEFFRSSLQMVQLPTALRMFESSFTYLAHSLQGAVLWINQSIERYMGWPKMEVELQSSQIADKIDLQNMMLQLMAAGKVSAQTALRTVGIKDPAAEGERVLEEQMEAQRQQIEANRRFQTEQTLGITAPSDPNSVAGSSPSGDQGGGVNRTPVQMQSTATDIAQQWFGILDTGTRMAQMRSVEATDPNLYAIAKAQYDKMKSQAGSQGTQMAQQQAAQQGQQPQQ